MIIRETISGKEVVDMYPSLSPTVKETLKKYLDLRTLDQVLQKFQSVSFSELELPVLVENDRILCFPKHNFDTGYINVLVNELVRAGYVRRGMHLIRTVDGPESEVLPNDIYKSRMLYDVDLSDGVYSYSYELLRMVCTNRSYVPDVSYRRAARVPASVEVLRHSPLLSPESPASWSVVAVRQKLSPLQHLPITCSNLLRAYQISKIFEQTSIVQTKYIKWTEQANLILSKYELMLSGLPSDDMFSLLSRQPKGWKDTALGSMSVYELWNDLTEIISRADESEDTDRTLDALVKAGSLLNESKNRMVVAQPKKL